MNLSDYLQTTTQAAFAKQLGVSQGLVSQWIRGRTAITAKRAIEIEDATNGAVSRFELLPEIFDRRKSA